MAVTSDGECAQPASSIKPAADLITAGGARGGARIFAGVVNAILGGARSGARISAGATAASGARGGADISGGAIATGGTRGGAGVSAGATVAGGTRGEAVSLMMPTLGLSKLAVPMVGLVSLSVLPLLAVLVAELVFYRCYRSGRRRWWSWCLWRCYLGRRCAWRHRGLRRCYRGRRYAWWG